MIPNPDFKGPWKAKMIDNPDYKGFWEAPEIPNPEFVDDPTIYKFDDLKYVGFELWQVKSGTIFDNIFVSDSIEEAAKFRDETWGAMKDAEKAMFDKIDEDRRDEEKAARDAADAEKAEIGEDEETEQEDEYSEEEEKEEDEYESEEAHDEL
jgi:calreticulin